MTSMQQARRVRRLRRLAVVVGLSLAALMTLGWLVVSTMVRSSPSWWRQVTPSDAQTQRVAQEVENAVGTHIHLGRDGSVGPDGVWRSEPWSVSIPASDANAWLNARLPKWIESLEPGMSLPRGVREVQVEFRDGTISVGVGYVSPGAHGGGDGGGQARVLWAVLGARMIGPEDDAAGLLVLSLERAFVGRLPVPLGMVSTELFGLDESGGGGTGGGTGGADSSGRRVLRSILKGEPLERAPVLKLEDGRRVRLTGVRARAGRLELTCVTEHGG
jgi:hypothetical protein